LQSNLKIIIGKYPTFDTKKLKDLLVELDNNIDLAVQILEEEISNCDKIID
jgi:hypothetical protein